MKSVKPQKNGLDYEDDSNDFENISQEENSEPAEITQSVTHFKPVYTVPMKTFLIQSKQFNYASKKFSTIPKKNDPVKRYQSLQKTWKKANLTKSNLHANREGRKLNLCTRIQNDKPTEVFYKYLPKFIHF